MFMNEVYKNLVDYDENLCRVIVVEVLVCRIVYNLLIDKLESVMSIRYWYCESDGDELVFSSVLEMVID